MNICSLIGVDSVEAVDILFTQAIHFRASDIHIDFSRYHSVIFLRIGTDTCFHTYISLDKAHMIVGRLKVLARLRLDVYDRTQDGSFDRDIDSTQIFVRISTAPTVYGENAVCRIFRTNNDKNYIEDLGLLPDQLHEIIKSIRKDSGIVLVTGATGSGKTTTLYSMIRHLLYCNKVIITIEDPVEVIIDGVRQVIARPEHGFGFADALRGVLRQDPDVIMVGEIRDADTAELAIHAALTGHLVLATLHAHSLHSIDKRLAGLGIDIASHREVFNMSIFQKKIKTISGPKIIFEIDTNAKAASDDGINTTANISIQNQLQDLCRSGLILQDQLEEYIR